MKKIFDVETTHKGNTYREAVKADSAEEAYRFIAEKYSKEKIIIVQERKNLK